MEYIGVQGTREDVFSCIDFYQKLSVVGSISIEDLRKSSIDMYLSDYKNRLDRKNKEASRVSVGVNYVPNGFYFDSEASLLGNTFVSHGVIFEDLEISDTTEEVSFKDTMSGVSVDYVSHGVLFDDVEDSYGLEEGFEDENYEDSFDEDYESAYIDDEEEFDSLFDDTDLDESVEGSTSDESFESLFNDEDDGFVFNEEVKPVKLDNTKDDFEEPQNKDRFSRRRFGRRIDVGSESSTSTIEKPKIIEESKPVQEVSHNVTEVSKSESYKDVRDFVKRNPGCTVSDVKKFFSQKDIQRALIGAKIVEKRQKLYIV